VKSIKHDIIFNILSVLDLIIKPKLYQSFWSTEIKKLIFEKFGEKTLSLSERNSNFNLFNFETVSQSRIFFRFCQFAGITFTSQKILNNAIEMMSRNDKEKYVN
jgi:hypothetical protein